MILDFGSFIRRWILADLEHPEEILGGHIADRARGVRPERRQQKTKTTDLPAVRE